MRIVINHLTRMQPGSICIAGIDPTSERHIRPVLDGSRLSRKLLVRNDGPVDMALEIDLGVVQNVGAPPELEDHRIVPDQMRFVSAYTKEEFWSLLQRNSHKTLTDIFGSELQQRDQSCVVASGMGKVSLGCFNPSEPLEIGLDGYGGIRASLSDGTFNANLSVTDLRLYEENQKTPRENEVKNVAKRIKEGVPVILSVGLTRPWKKPGDTEYRHWLQVNNIHLKDNPIWQVGV